MGTTRYIEAIYLSHGYPIDCCEFPSSPSHVRGASPLKNAHLFRNPHHSQAMQRLSSTLPLPSANMPAPSRQEVRTPPAPPKFNAVRLPAQPAVPAPRLLQGQDSKASERGGRAVPSYAQTLAQAHPHASSLSSSHALPEVNFSSMSSSSLSPHARPNPQDTLHRPDLDSKPLGLMTAFGALALGERKHVASVESDAPALQQALAAAHSAAETEAAMLEAWYTAQKSIETQAAAGAPRMDTSKTEASQAPLDVFCDASGQIPKGNWKEACKMVLDKADSGEIEISALARSLAHLTRQTDQRNGDFETVLLDSYQRHDISAAKFAALLEALCSAQTGQPPDHPDHLRRLVEFAGHLPRARPDVIADRGGALTEVLVMAAQHSGVDANTVRRQMLRAILETRLVPELACPTAQGDVMLLGDETYETVRGLVDANMGASAAGAEAALFEELVGGAIRGLTPEILCHALTALHSLTDDDKLAGLLARLLANKALSPAHKGTAGLVLAQNIDPKVARDTLFCFCADGDVYIHFDGDDVNRLFAFVPDKDKAAWLDCLRAMRQDAEATQLKSESGTLTMTEWLANAADLDAAIAQAARQLPTAKEAAVPPAPKPLSVPTATETVPRSRL